MSAMIINWVSEFVQQIWKYLKSESYFIIFLRDRESNLIV